MAVEANLTTGTTSFARARDIDFVNKFGGQIAGMKDILNITRVMPLSEGAVVKTYKSTVTLDGTVVAPGDIIPLSLVKEEVEQTYELTWDKKRKGVPAEDIQKYGFNQAIVRTDNAFMGEIRGNVVKNFYTNLLTGTGAATGEGLQMAAAQARAGVVKAFDDSEETILVGFVNTDDLADYLGKASITVQNQFGLRYVENFLGFNVVIESSRIPKGTFVATAADNLVLAFADMNSETAKVFELKADEVLPVITKINSGNYCSISYYVIC